MSQEPVGPGPSPPVAARGPLPDAAPLTPGVRLVEMPDAGGHAPVVGLTDAHVRPARARHTMTLWPRRRASRSSREILTDMYLDR